jgi:hypothetical protein
VVQPRQPVENSAPQRPRPAPVDYRLTAMKRFLAESKRMLDEPLEWQRQASPAIRAGAARRSTAPSNRLASHDASYRSEKPRRSDRMSSGAGYTLFRDARPFEERCRGMVDAAGS